MPARLIIVSDPATAFLPGWIQRSFVPVSNSVELKPDRTSLRKSFWGHLLEKHRVVYDEAKAQMQSKLGNLFDAAEFEAAWTSFIADIEDCTRAFIAPPARFQ